MSATATALRAWTSGAPTIEDVGGEDLIYSERAELLDDPSLTDVVRLLCRSWPGLTRPAEAADFLIAATQSVHLAEFADILDVVLTSVDALPMIAPELVGVLRKQSQADDLRADIAVEAWTRLALGQWCLTLEPRSALVVLAGDGHTSPYVIRALGAALAEWRDSDIEQVMLQLADDEEVECDIAMELGAYRLVCAAGSSTAEQAIAELRTSSEWFARADGTEERRDAPAFRLAADSLLAFADGGTVTAEQVESMEAAASDYLQLYRNLEPHWRQPRAQAIVEWVSLVQSMRRVSELTKPAWFEPAALIDQAAALFSAHQSLTLVVQWGDALAVRPGMASTSNLGIAAIVQPKIKSGFAGQAHSMVFLDRWLESRERLLADGEKMSNEDLRFIHAITDVANGANESPPKPFSEPSMAISAARAFLTSSRVNASETLRVEVVNATPLVVPVRPLSLEAERVVRRILADSTAIAGPFPIEVEQAALSTISVMVMYSAYLIDNVQSGERKVPFLGFGKPPFPKEHNLADGLNDRFLAAGLPSQIERTDTGGGRVDIALQFDRFQLYVEVKRELTSRADADLFASYASQAVQYASTSVALAFLAVLDYSKHLVRVDLDHAFWTAAHQTPASRVYAVTGLRVQGNVDSPSKGSKSRAAPAKRI
jgi:hypothetical protein